MNLDEDLIAPTTSKAELRDVALLRVSRRVATGDPRVPASRHDEAMALPLRNAPVAQRVGPRATPPHQALCALRLSTLEGHPHERRRPHRRLRTGRRTTAGGIRTTRWLRARLSDIGLVDVLVVAWTVADLAGHPVTGADDVAEALGMRVQRAAA